MPASALQLSQHAARRAFADRRQQRAFLNFLAGDIERQIGAVDEAAHEAQIARQNVGIVGNENPFDVELDAAFAIRIEQVERSRAGHEEQAGVVVPAFGVEVDRQCRLVELSGNAAIKIGVVGRLDFGFRLGPKRGTVADFGGLGAGLFDNRNRHRHVTRLRPDEALDRRPFGVAGRIRHQMQYDAGAPPRRLGRHRIDRRDGEAAFAVGRPHPGRVRTGAPRNHVHPVGDHEGRIEADAEPADQRGFLVRLGGFDPVDEGFGAGPGDGAERLHHLLAAHADAVVFDGELFGIRIEPDRDPRLRIVAEQRGRGDRFVAQPLAGIGGVGDQLPKKYRFLGIDRMHHEL